MKDALRKILVALCLVSAAMAIYYFVLMIIEGDYVHGFVPAVSYCTCMLGGSFIGLMACYTVRTNRDDTDDKNQLNAGIVFVLLGIAIATTISTLGIAKHTPIMMGYYLQTIMIFAILVAFRISYRGKR